MNYKAPTYSLTGDEETAPHLKSHAFDTTVALNPLFAAAAPLINLALDLREQAHQPKELNAFHDLFCQEVRVFENKAQALGYLPTMTLAARYLLCAFVDEMILTSTWGQNSTWREQHLLKTFQGEAWGGERYFVIIERALEDPKAHLDLLELAYVCLSLGYEGKYRLKPNGSQKLLPLIDHLYQLIREERGEFSKRFTSIMPAPTLPFKKRKLIFPPIWLTITTTCAILIGIYTMYYIQITRVTTSLKQVLQSTLPSSFSSDHYDETDQ